MTYWSENLCRNALQTLAFHEMEKLIMKDITNTTFPILVNEIPRESFRPARGLRLGSNFSISYYYLCRISWRIYTLSLKYTKS